MANSHRLIHRQIIMLITTAVVVVGLAVIFSSGHFAVLNPAGSVASRQKHLLITATILMSLIVVPVIGLTFGIAWKYRASNTKAAYKPDWDGSKKLEAIWWGFPLIIVASLAVLAWQTSHSLDPSRALASAQKPLTIQVVALQWKWLFLYPEQQVATVNYVQMPVGRPVNFEITSDAPMNSFWIPQLGGQIYAMSGMSTHLNLEADKAGSYRGLSANLSGNGFSRMVFEAKATSPSEFDSWASATKRSSDSLSLTSYGALSSPTILENTKSYASYEPGLYNTILLKYAGVSDAR